MPRITTSAREVSSVWSKINPEDLIKAIKNNYEIDDRIEILLNIITEAFIANNSDVEIAKDEAIYNGDDPDTWPVHYSFPSIGRCFVYNMEDERNTPVDYIIFIFNGRKDVVSGYNQWEIIPLRSVMRKEESPKKVNFMEEY